MTVLLPPGAFEPTVLSYVESFRPFLDVAPWLLDQVTPFEDSKEAIVIPVWMSKLRRRLDALSLDEQRAAWAKTRDPDWVRAFLVVCETDLTAIYAFIKGASVSPLAP